MLHSVYVFCLAVGVLYSFLSLVFHCFSASLDMGLDLDLGLETNFDIFLPIKPFTVMVFITVFGGVGLITESYVNILYSAVFSISSAYFVSNFLYRTVYLRLVHAQTETKSSKDAVGVEATILESIPSNGLGRISYIVDGNILSGVAKRYDSNNVTLTDECYKKGQKVYIIDVSDNIYYVSLKLVNIN